MAAEMEDRLSDLLEGDTPRPGFDPLAAVLRAWAEDIDSAPITATGWPLVRKDYGPRGACAPKAALLAAAAVSLAASAVWTARRWWR